MTYDATGSAGAGTGVGDQSTTDQAKERAAEMAGQAQEKVRDALEDQVDQRSNQAAEQVESVADDVRAVSESLSDRGQDAAARIVEQGAEYAQQLSDYLRNSNSDQILDDVASFARRQPWVVAAGGLLLGFAASRVLRASASNSSSGSSDTRSTLGGTSSTGGYGYASGGYPSTTYTTPAPSQMPAPMTTPAPDPLVTTQGGYATEASFVDGR